MLLQTIHLSWYSIGFWSCNYIVTTVSLTIYSVRCNDNDKYKKKRWLLSIWSFLARTFHTCFLALKQSQAPEGLTSNAIGIYGNIDNIVVKSYYAPLLPSMNETRICLVKWYNFISVQQHINWTTKKESSYKHRYRYRLRPIRW